MMDPNQRIGGPDAPYRRNTAAAQELAGTNVTRTTQMRMARMLRLYIAASDTTQKQVAAEAGIAESTLSRFLAGEQMPDARGFLALLTWCWGEHRT